MTERRFTDQDVAVILRRASELDRGSHDTGGRGLSLQDLQDIGREVGIDPEVVRRAASEVSRRERVHLDALFGATPVHRQLRAVAGELGREELTELVRVVDARVPAQGTVAEALGTIRWNSSERFLSRQVSFEPSTEDTLIRVEERFPDRVRAMLHAIPAAYGLVFGLALGLKLVGGLVAGAAFSAVLAAMGWTAGRPIWNVLAGRSRRRVEALADELAERAGALRADGAEI